MSGCAIVTSIYANSFNEGLGLLRHQPSQEAPDLLLLDFDQK